MHYWSLPWDWNTLDSVRAIHSFLEAGALVCFAMYVGLALRGKPREEGGTLNLEHRTSNLEHRTLALPTVCRAGAVVLLVGFWFDGGLFRLATGAKPARK